MDEVIDTKSLMKVSTLAKATNKSTAWVYDLAKESLVDTVKIDGVLFIKVNDKSIKYLK